MADPKNAIPELEKAMITYPNNPKLYNFLSKAYAAIGRTKKAKELIIENFRRNPDYFFARLNYAELLFTIPSPISMSSFGFGSHPARLAVAWRLRGIQR